MNNSVSKVSSVDKIDKAYSSKPWWYDGRGFLILTFAYNDTLPHQVRHFSEHLRAKHLEAAVGSGTFLELVLKYRRWKNLRHPKIVGFDYARSMLEGAKHRFRNDPEIDLQLADAAHLPFKDGEFESISCANAIHSFPEIEKSLDELYRVLKKDGIFIGNCLIHPRGILPLRWVAQRINKWGQKKGILHRSYALEEIKKLLGDAGFQLEKEKLRGNCFSFIAKK